jgi:hypothetical protein
LFHWSCPDCSITPLLIPQYREVYDECRRLFSGKSALAAPFYKWLIKGTAIAASLSLLIGGATALFPAQVKALPPQDDPHWLPLPDGNDLDGDFLDDHQEKIIGLETNTPDTDGDGIVDGIQLARQLHAEYEQCPHEPRQDGPYVTDYLMWGLETCAICNATINMGYARLYNPLENLSIDIPYISLHHFLEHGSFAYDGSEHGNGFINAALLDIVLNGDGSSHRLDIKDDNDKDGMTDTDERFFSCDPQNSDTDGDGIADGIYWARQFAEIIDGLPRSEHSDCVYALDRSMMGVECCHRCGETFNMGYLEIVNPMSNISVNVPFIAVHFLQCGGFAFQGDVNADVLSPETLRKVLLTRGELHQLAVSGDADRDGLTSDEEHYFQTDPDNTDTNNDGICDGAQLATFYARYIDELTETPGHDVCYKEHHMFRGIEYCEICGTSVNMGFVRLINPHKSEDMDIPYIALHYMEHGSFSHAGDLQQGRIDPVALADHLTDNPTGVPAAAPEIPVKIALDQNYPNPFNASTTIPFTLSGRDAAQVSIRIYNTLGEEVRTLLEAEKAPGNWRITWDGNNSIGTPVPAGVYLVRLQAGRHSDTKKLVLTR